MSTAQHIYRLKGKVQHYSWGGYEYIPQLLSIDNTDNKPFAEYWMGAHPNFPSVVEKQDGDASLYDLILENPQGVLGTNIASGFTSLPFLFKVLDVRQMLSIQVHPSKSSAELGFRDENEKGIALTDSHRNYKDDNHKPELMVALSDFWLLHGFKPAEKLVSTLSAVPEFEFLVSEFERGGYKALYEKVMLMPQADVNNILSPIIERIVPLYKNGELLKSGEDFWTARATETFCKDSNYDRGIFSIFFFNLVHLKKGEGIYQPAQMPHAYLEGQNIEIMANSDNVLRAGLTDKHIDVQELLKHVKFEETVPNVLGSQAEVSTEVEFAPPAKEFGLYQYNLPESITNLQSISAEIILVLDGAVSITSGDELQQLSKGETAFITADTAYTLQVKEGAEVFRAVVGK